jgi:hypothetical protein
MSRRTLVVGAVAAAAILALIPVGRWERQHRADVEMRGMEKVLAAMGPLDEKRCPATSASPSSCLKGFRVLANFDCLVYQRGGYPYALEVCADDDGRVIETIDRRSGDPRISSLRDDPTSSDVRVDRREFDRLLVRMGVPARLLPTTSS